MSVISVIRLPRRPCDDRDNAYHLGHGAVETAANPDPEDRDGERQHRDQQQRGRGVPHRVDKDVVELVDLGARATVTATRRAAGEEGDAAQDQKTPVSGSRRPTGGGCGLRSSCSPRAPWDRPRWWPHASWGAPRRQGWCRNGSASVGGVPEPAGTGAAGSDYLPGGVSAVPRSLLPRRRTSRPTVRRRNPVPPAPETP